MREKLIELIDKLQYQGNSAQTGVNYIQNSEIADYLLKNGVVILPCRVGDTVYTTFHGWLSEYKVIELVKNDFLWAKLYNPDYSPEDRNERVCLDFSFGNFVFLTREEADKALLKCGKK